MFANIFRYIYLFYNYQLFYKPFVWFKVKIEKIKLLYSLLNSLKLEPIVKQPYCIFNNNTANLSYENMGQTYKLYLPYRRDLISGMYLYNAQLIYPDQTYCDITQSPGIPYLVSAYDLGGVCIKIINNATGQSYEYKDKHIPMFANEIITLEE